MEKQTKTSIGLSNGNFFNYNSPETHEYDIEAIASSLSKLCRYNGHTDGDKFYSVAEHSVLVSYLVPEHYAFEGLMHDSSEAFTGDIQKPLKEMLPNLKEIEERIEKAMAQFYGLRFPYPPEIKEADKLVYKCERAQIATAIEDNFWHVDVVADPKVKIRCLAPKQARKLFLDRYNELRYNTNLKAA